MQAAKANAVRIKPVNLGKAKDQSDLGRSWHHPAEETNSCNVIHLLPSLCFALEMALDRPVFNQTPDPRLVFIERKQLEAANVAN
jgi:hypothetical protein